MRRTFTVVWYVNAKRISPSSFSLDAFDDSQFLQYHEEKRAVARVTTASGIKDSRFIVLQHTGINNVTAKGLESVVQIVERDNNFGMPAQIRDIVLAVSDDS